MGPSLAAVRRRIAEHRRTIVVAAAASGAAFLLLAAFIAYCAYTLPVSSRSPTAELPPANVLYATSSGTTFAARGVYRGERIAADHLPADLAHAVVAIEDRRFYRHHGVDLHGITRAAWRNLWHRGGLEGGSTITQQLARLTYLSPERTVRRKLQEIMLAVWLEARLSKDEILARYLNSVYFGAGAVGADAAAKRYFGKKVGELDLAESAMLAGLVRAPSHLAPSRNPKAAHRRAELVLAAMVETGTIDKAQAAKARAEPVKLAVPPETEPDDNYFVDAADAEIKRLIGAAPLDLTVTTTLDPRLQDAAARTVKFWLGGEGAKHNVGQAALIAMAPDGAILAMVGGRDYNESQFNRATQAKRQPGSLFKIFVYLTALSNGYRPDSVMVDQPVQIGDWAPKNYDDKYHGPVSLRTAFAQSMNSVAAQLIQAVGIERVIEMARSLGVQSELPAIPGIALGSAEVTLIEMTRAMDAIATRSKSIESFMIRSIRTQSATLYTRPETVADKASWAWAPMMNLLEAVVTEGTGKAARLDRRAGGKTGTTDEYRDAWFVGFTTDLVVGVWVGNDDNTPMDHVAGGDIPARIWHDFMTEAERILAKPLPPAPATGPQTAALTGSATPPPPVPAPPPPVPPAPATPVAAVTPPPPPAPPKAEPPAPPPTPAAVTPPAPAAPPKAEPPAPPPTPVVATPSPPPAAPAPQAEPSVQQAAAAPPPSAKPATMQGVPMVIDTGTLMLNGGVVHLNGVVGETGEPTRQLLRYMGGREVACDPVEGGDAQYRCRIGDYDLAEAVLLNGAGRAGANAPERLRNAEQQARTARRGIWSR